MKWVVLVLFVLLSVAHTWPLASAPRRLSRNDNGDTLLCYDYTTADGTNTTRKGYFLYVESYYHLQVFMPLLQPFLPDDPGKGAPWIRLPGRITVVIN